VQLAGYALDRPESGRRGWLLLVYLADLGAAAADAGSWVSAATLPGLSASPVDRALAAQLGAAGGRRQ
jgi:hypothetical protein